MIKGIILETMKIFSNEVNKINSSIKLEHSRKIQSIINEYGFHINECCKSIMCPNPIFFASKKGFLNHGAVLHFINFVEESPAELKYNFVYCMNQSYNDFYIVLFF